MANDPARVSQALDRDLLRRAGEHLGTLAEQAREKYLINERDAMRKAGFGQLAADAWKRITKLERLSREVLEIANA
jgi:hypothetical protein